jgi:hypothetical protein
MDSPQIPRCDFGQAKRKGAAMIKLQTFSKPAVPAPEWFDGQCNRSIVPRERAGGGQC